MKANTDNTLQSHTQLISQRKSKLVNWFSNIDWSSPKSTYYMISSASVTIMFAVWIFVTETGIANEIFLPGPIAIYDAFIRVLFEGYQGSTLLEHVGTSLFRILSAFGLACLVGIPLGIAMGMSRNVHAAFNPFIEFYRPLPPLGLYTLLVMWLGIGESSKLALLFLAGLPGIIIATIKQNATCSRSLSPFCRANDTNRHENFSRFCLYRFSRGRNCCRHCGNRLDDLGCR